MPHLLYPEYKDSGVPWLGSVPAHWEVKPLKTLCSFLGGGTPSTDKPSFWDGDIPWVSAKDMKREFIDDTEDHITEEGVVASAASIIPTNSVLLVVRSGILKHTIPVAINTRPLTVNQDMRAVVFKCGVAPEFFLRWVQGFQNDLLTAWRKQGATVESLEHSYVANTNIPLPPLAEQREIAGWLDGKIGEIDKAVVAQRTLLEQLKEKRRALIAHAVTRGLDPAVPLRPSNIPWLGDVPAHWEVKKIGYMASLQSGEAITAEVIQEAGPYPVFGGNGLRGYTDAYTHEGDLVLVGRQGALCGNINYGFGKFWATEHALVAAPLSNYCCKWFGATLLAMNLGQYSITAAQPGLAASAIARLKLPVPPLVEQQAIAAYLDEETQKLDELATETERTLALLQEHRTALIAGAVTGKFRVCTV